MPFDRRTWIGPLGAACRGGVLACVVYLAPAPCSAQSYLHVSSQTTVHLGCIEIACECFDGGAAKTCPVTHERGYDSGPVFTNNAGDADTSDVVGNYSDSTTYSQTSLNAHADYGELRGLAWTRAFASGTYVETGGLAYPADAKVDIDVSFSDDLTLMGAVPQGPVSIRLWQQISSADLELIRGSDDFPVLNRCLANGDATTRLYAVLMTTHLGLGGGDQSVGYLRETSECYSPTVSGLPFDGIEIHGHDGDMVHVGQDVTLQSYSFMGGGVGLTNRVIFANSSIDASNTAKMLIEILTPGASYTSMSGAVYEPFTGTSTTTSSTSTTTVTTSTSTSSPTSSSTSTTLVTGCDAVPDGPTFASILCRVAALRAAATGKLGGLQTKLDQSLGKALDGTRMADDLCASADKKHAKARLKQVLRQLTQYSHRLQGGKARKTPAEIRTPLAAEATAIRGDASTLRTKLRCPDDAS